MNTVLVVLLCGSLQAQEFEAATVKASNSDNAGTLVDFAPGGGLRVTNATLKDLIETAYQVRSFQILAGPSLAGSSWMGVTRYDVTATSGAPTTAGEVRQRVQALLKDRFQLKLHREMRQLPVYSLIVVKKGIRAESLRVSNNPHKGINARQGAMTGEAASMANLAAVLFKQLGRPVVNNTGLDGNYDFTLQWMPDLNPAAPDGQTGVDLVGPSLFTALQEQLGLRLEAAKGPVEVIVIDHVERPSDN